MNKNEMLGCAVALLYFLLIVVIYVSAINGNYNVSLIAFSVLVILITISNFFEL